MISIYAFSIFLWACLCVQVSVEGHHITLKKLSRLDEGKHYKLIAEYEADESIEIRWWQYSKDGEKELDGVTQNGMTTYEVKKEKYGPAVYLQLGDDKDHYFLVGWNVEGDGNIVLPMDLPMVKVTPGTDLVHVPGTVTNVTIAVDESRGNSVFDSNVQMSAYGEYLNEDGTNVEGAEAPSFIQKYYESKDGVMTTTLSFGEGYSHSINGYFMSGVWGYSHDKENVPVEELSEFIVLKVHEASNSGPFPDDFISGYAEDQTCEEIWSGYISCSIYCTTYANDMDKVEIFKVNNGKEEKQDGVKVEASSPYTQWVTLDLDANSPETPGTYVCRATSKSGDTWKKKLTVTVDI